MTSCHAHIMLRALQSLRTATPNDMLRLASTSIAPAPNYASTTLEQRRVLLVVERGTLAPVRNAVKYSTSRA
jgi:hypothetical protein